jgi:WD40 repeat protein
MQCTGMIDVGLPGISSLAEAGNCIAVASRNHHAIRLVDTKGELTRVCIGHGAGVTCLAGLTDNQFVSGAADRVAKVWDSRNLEPVMAFVGHMCPLTVVGGRTYVVTGADDHVVKAWDLRSDKPLFRVPVGPGIPVAVSMEDDHNLVVITKEKDTSCAEWCQAQQTDHSERLLDPTPNLGLYVVLADPPPHACFECWR